MRMIQEFNRRPTLNAGGTFQTMVSQNEEKGEKVGSQLSSGIPFPLLSGLYFGPNKLLPWLPCHDGPYPPSHGMT